tara:strand:- start:4007 stop:4309 length:303 start_codon:yes stop_codon:yes gene_type:complete
VIHLALFIILILSSGCASQTALISHAATSSAASAAVARAHLVAASAELDSIEAQAQAVSDAIPYVSDDVPAIYSTLQYVSVAVVAAVIGALIYTYIPRGR